MADSEMSENMIEVRTETDLFRLKGRPCELSAFSFIPISRSVPPERTVFNSVPGSLSEGVQETPVVEEVVSTHQTYDRLFTNQDFDYNAKLHRDDREHCKSQGLKVHVEEEKKDVPTLASTEYGHRIEQFLDPPGRKHRRIAHVKAEFYRRNGVTS